MSQQSTWSRVWVSFAWGTILSILVLAGNLTTGLAQDTAFLTGPGSGQNARLELVTSTTGYAILELDVPGAWLETVEENGQQYVVVSASGLDDAAAPGHPRLPQIGVLLGLPPSGGWSVQILAGEEQVISLAHPLAPGSDPNPVSPGFGLDASPAGSGKLKARSLYTTDAFYPASPVTVQEIAVLRDLRTLPLSLQFRTRRAGLYPAAGCTHRIRAT